MLGLAADRGLPAQPEPGEVLEDGGLEFRPAAGPVDVLDAQQKTPARLSRRGFREQRRIGMAEMEMARGAGGEARDHGAARALVGSGLRHDVTIACGFE